LRVTLDHARYRDLFHKVYEEEFAIKYPDGYHVDWHQKPHGDWDKTKLSKSLPIDIFYQLYPITATLIWRNKIATTYSS